MKAKDLVVGARYVYVGIPDKTFIFVEGPAELTRRRWVFRCPEDATIDRLAQCELKYLVREAAK